MAKSIMIQGTMSNAGKSILAAGLCRIFKQDGYRVAPFKSQNMALNSYITRDGLEMGRAQVVQAEAAGVEPDVAMNPILLKPTNDIGSQVIVNGEVLGTMPAREYFKMKKSLIPAILRAYRKLEEEYEIIVIEGAGSPAEINLKTDDIVNMGLAKLVDAPVLLVGDIDRGGVFAQLVGTVMLLEEEEKQRIKGLIINKFRGDQTILDPGIEMLKSYISNPVVGVVPHMAVDIEDEDSLSERLLETRKQAPVDIAVIRLPRISNFTDFDVFAQSAFMAVRYVSHPAQFGAPDMVILPGTKSTAADLLWMRQNGLEAMILKAAKAGTIVFGICGGYQMLGQSITDEWGMESAVHTGQKKIRGMGLLPIQTSFCREKTRTNVKGSVGKTSGKLSALEGAAVCGYEIHMGESKGEIGWLAVEESKDSAEKGGGRPDGCCRENVYGTYLHGFFDSGDVMERLEKLLLLEKGMTPDTAKHWDRRAYKEQQYDKLAEILRAHLDMDAIYRILDPSHRANPSDAGEAQSPAKISLSTKNASRSL